MVAVGEAHGVSKWGQEFRPGYLKIVEFIDRLKDRPNLYFGVQSPKDKFETMKNFLEIYPGESGIKRRREEEKPGGLCYINDRSNEAV